ncbi:MAG: T9SS type A sorting domain-containing protein [Bacteroidota bacterium]
MSSLLLQILLPPLATEKKRYLHIYNTKGQQVRQLFLHSAVSNVDIKDFSSGVYLYRLLSDGKEYRGKFIKN